MKKNDLSNQMFEIKPMALLIFDNPFSRDGEDGALLNADYPLELEKALSKRFRVSMCAGKAGDIWQILFNEIPSVIVISQTVREIDAVGMIRSLKASKYKFDIRYFLCCRSVNSSVKSICERTGIDAAFVFGEDAEAAAEMIYQKFSEMLATSGERRLDSIVRMLSDGSYFNDSREVFEFGSKISEAMLVPLGFDASHNGTRYVELIICLRVFGAEKNMSRLYSLAAECYNTTPTAVEKSIRYSIEFAWSGSSPYMQYRLFGNSVDPERGKPTNSEFIETIVRHTKERLHRNTSYDLPSDGIR